MAGFEAALVAYEAVGSIPATGVLVLAPHPDDEVLGCGGAILTHIQQGAAVRVVVITDGAFGLSGERRARHAALRREEALRAADVLGYGRPVFWTLPDQEVVCGEALISAIAEVIGDADLVYAPSVFEMHPDHRAVGLAAAEAVRRRVGVRLALYEVSAPLRPNLLLDISDVMDVKQTALECYASQLSVQPYDEYVRALNRYRSYTLPNEVRAAEAFRMVEPADIAQGALGLYAAELRVQERAARTLFQRQTPLVSVVIRTLGRTTLSDALRSVAEQTYQQIEVVLVDALGGTGQLPRECGVFPVSVVRTAESLGRSRAANAGLQAATGDLLIFLDDDDLFLPDHVAGLVDTLSATPGACAAHAGVSVLGPDGPIDTYDAPVVRDRLKAWNQLPINAVLFERSLVEAGCRFDEDLELYEDWDFWLQVAERTEFARRPGVSALYRVHLGGSGLYGPGAELLQAEWRSRVLSKWAVRWGPDNLLRVLDELRAAERERAQAAFTAGELQRLLQEARREVCSLDELRFREVRELQQAIHELRHSSSWRLTAPFRRAVDSFRQAARGNSPR